MMANQFAHLIPDMTESKVYIAQVVVVLLVVWRQGWWVGWR